MSETEMKVHGEPSEEFLSEIRTFDDALAFGAAQGGLIDISDPDWGIGTGFSVLPNDEKARLIGVPFVIVKATDHQGDHGLFYSMHIVTQNGDRYILNDGSTGICEQMNRLYTKRPDIMDRPLIVRDGLRVSRYVHPEHGPSETFYLSV